MFAESPPSSTKLWTVIMTVIGTWILAGTWIWRNPMPVTVDAVVQVAPGTDPGTLCSRPEIIQDAARRLAESQRSKGVDTLSSDESAGNQDNLTGRVSARKAVDGTWILSCSAATRDLAHRELTVFVAALERHLAMPANEKATAERKRLEEKLRQLNSKQAAIQLEDRIVPVGYESGTDLESSELESHSDVPEEKTGIQERIKTLERAVTEARVDRIRTEEEVRLVDHSFKTGKKLESLVTQLSAGPIQDAVRQIDKQARLSGELQQLDSVLSSDSEIYGDKHPRLIDLRRRFGRLLQELGGWENLLAESAIQDQLTASLEQILQLRREREDDLQLELDLEQSELQEQGQATRTQSLELITLKKIRSEIAETQLALSELEKPIAAGFSLLKAPSMNSPPPLWQRGWPWLAVIVVRLTVGWGVSCIRRFDRSQEYPIFGDEPLLTVPQLTFATSPVPERAAPAPSTPNENLNLAQRRAVRQSRWQQTYS